MNHPVAVSNDWYQSLVDDLVAIHTEAVFNSRWELLVGYHTIGKRIMEETRLVWNARGNGATLSDLSKSTGIMKRDLYRAIQFYRKYPSLDDVPGGKNISWTKVVALLPKENEPKPSLAEECAGRGEMSEHDEQVLVIDWCLRHLDIYPELDLIFAVPNGAMLGGGKIGAIRMNALKAEGLRPGVSDLCLPVARRGFHGAFIEMKTETGKLSENQEQFIASVEKQGYYTAVCYGAEEAKKTLQWYMSTETEKR